MRVTKSERRERVKEYRRYLDITQNIAQKLTKELQSQLAHKIPKYE